MKYTIYYFKLSPLCKTKLNKMVDTVMEIVTSLVPIFYHLHTKDSFLINQL